MKLHEVANKKGTYAGVRFSEKTTEALQKYIKDNNIPNGLASNKMHTTLLYSRKFLPDYTAPGVYDAPMVGKLGDFDVWKSNNEDGDEQTNCLIVEYDCPELNNRHEYLMRVHGATFDYPHYKTHITLSYNIGDLDIEKLPDIKKVIPQVEIVSEYQEELNLNWAKEN
jgi:hypothetical protein